MKGVDRFLDLLIGGLALLWVAAKAAVMAGICLVLGGAIFLAGREILTGNEIEPADGQGGGMAGVRCVHAPVFKNAAQPGVACAIESHELRSGETYKFSGDMLAIRGDIPDNVTIKARKGKIFVEGSVGKGVTLSAAAPETCTLTDSFGACTNEVRVYPGDRDHMIMITGQSQHDTKFYNGGARVMNHNDLTQENYHALPAARAALAALKL